MADLSRVVLVSRTHRNAMVRVAEEALAKAYRIPMTPWLPLLRRSDSTIGRKRRARRARGRARERRPDV